MKTKRTSKPTRPGRPDKFLIRGWWHGLSTRGRRTLLLACVHLVVLGGLAGGIGLGLRAADSYVHRLDRYQGPIKVVLRIKNHKNDVLVTTRQIKDAGLEAGTAVIYKERAGASQVVVEHKGKSIRLATDDVQPDWLARFQYVGKDVQRRAEALANVSSGKQGSGNSPDWFDAPLGRIRDAAAAEPFVEKVVQIDKQLVAGESGPQPFSRQIVMTVVLRKPVAHMFVDDRWGKPHGYLLDAKGVVLEVRPSLVGLPQLADFAVNPQWRKDGLKPGTALNAPDVQAGLDLLVKLAGQPFYGEITEVNLDNFDRKKNPRGSQLKFKTLPVPSEGLGPDTYGWGMPKDNLDIERNNSQAKIKIINESWATYGRLNLQHLKRDKTAETNLWLRQGSAFIVEPKDLAGSGSPTPPPPRGGHLARHD